jgi:hypothetical protein
MIVLMIVTTITVIPLGIVQVFITTDSTRYSDSNLYLFFVDFCCRLAYNVLLSVFLLVLVILTSTYGIKLILVLREVSPTSPLEFVSFVKRVKLSIQIDVDIISDNLCHFRIEHLCGIAAGYDDHLCCSWKKTLDLHHNPLYLESG